MSAVDVERLLQELLSSVVPEFTEEAEAPAAAEAAAPPAPAAAAAAAPAIGAAPAAAAGLEEFVSGILGEVMPRVEFAEYVAPAPAVKPAAAAPVSAARTATKSVTVKPLPADVTAVLEDVEGVLLNLLARETGRFFDESGGFADLSVKTVDASVSLMQKILNLAQDIHSWLEKCGTYAPESVSAPSVRVVERESVVESSGSAAG